MLPIQAHATDLANVYGGDDMTDYLVRFVANLDPNGDTGINWPKWTTESPNMMTFSDGPTRQTITQDTYRQEPMAYLINLTLANPI
jgi:carboxylesterase type B